MRTAWTVIGESHSQRLVSDSYTVSLQSLTLAVDDLRFAKPQDAVWNSTTFEAKTKPPSCLQANSSSYTNATGTSEDCLFLNVQVPEGSNGQTAWYPVMVWMWVFLCLHRVTEREGEKLTEATEGASRAARRPFTTAL